MDFLSLLIPIAYLIILIGSLATFSSIYRRRKAASVLNLEPYFPPHTQRDVYNSLMNLEGETKVPDSILRAALLARAQEDITRIIEIRTRKQAMSTLLQRGVIGDEIWQRLLRAEQEMEAEVKDVVAEANAFVPNWGQTIFQSASEMAARALLNEKLDAIQGSIAREKEAWEKKREGIKEGFMKEIEDEKKVSETTEKTVPAAVKSQSSDDDAVLVETPGAATSGGAGKSKKKKGKK